MSERKPRGVPRKPTDQPAACVRCDKPATITLWQPLYTGSTAFYPYCQACWNSRQTREHLENACKR